MLTSQQVYILIFKVKLSTLWTMDNNFASMSLINRRISAALSNELAFFENIHSGPKNFLVLQ